MIRLLALIAAVVAAACAAPAPSRPERVVTVPEPTPYEGRHQGDLLVMEATAALPERTLAAAMELERTLGLSLDPERRRTLGLGDVPEAVWIQTRVVGGNRVQEIRLSARVIARAESGLTPLLREALCRASLSDLPRDILPDWFVRGAPAHFARTTMTLVHGRILSGPEVRLEADRVAPPLDPFAAGGDPLSSALFLRFVASEFGPKTLPDLTRALLASPDLDRAFSAALRADAASLPVAFESYRRRVVGGILDEADLQELAAARGLPLGERLERLDGLAGRPKNGFVATAVLEDLALAQLESGEHEAAAATCREVARNHVARSFHPDRVRYIVVAALMRGGDVDRAEGAVGSFVRDHPASRWCPPALLELGERMGAAGRPDDAARALEDLTARYPGTEPARRAHLLLGAGDLARGRYALARAHLERAAPLPEAERLLLELAGLEQADLPAEAAGRVEAALRDLASADDALGESAVRTLSEVGPRALPLLDHALGLDERLLPLTHAPLAFRLRLVRVCSAWSLSGAIAPLTRLLTDPEPAVARAALQTMLALGARSAKVADIIDGHPFDTGAAREVYRERFGAEVPGEVRDLLASDDHTKRIEAARVLADLDRPGSLDALARLAGDRSPQVRREAAAALGHREEEPAADILAGALSDPSPLVRLAAVHSLARLGRLEHVRSAGLLDLDGRVRVGASRALLSAGEKGDAARVVALLADPDSSVRVVLEGLLGETEGPEVAEALAAALRSAREAGFAARIVRVMAHQSRTDFGYDPGGDPAERARVADAFLDSRRRE